MTIIELLITSLSEIFEGLYIGVEAPESSTDYVLLDQTASRRSNHITTTTVAVQSYGDSYLDAMTLSAEIESAMLNEVVEADEIASIKLQTDYNFTDTATKQYRWQAVYEITHYLGGN